MQIRPFRLVARVQNDALIMASVKSWTVIKSMELFKAIKTNSESWIDCKFLLQEFWTFWTDHMMSVGSRIAWTGEISAWIFVDFIAVPDVKVIMAIIWCWFQAADINFLILLERLDLKNGNHFPFRRFSVKTVLLLAFRIFTGHGTGLNVLFWTFSQSVKTLESSSGKTSFKPYCIRRWCLSVLVRRRRPRHFCTALYRSDLNGVFYSEFLRQSTSFNRCSRVCRVCRIR